MLAPLGGGPATPALAAAVIEAGGLGFLAAGYKTASATRDDVAELRELTGGAFGLSLFAPPAGEPDAEAVRAYAESLRGEAERYGASVGEPRRDDDDWEAKLSLCVCEAIPVVSFTFGCPAAEELTRLRDAGCETWVTVTTPAEARIAERAGADGLVVQGVEAGGHRGSFDPERPGELGLLALLQIVRSQTALPLMATGGIAGQAGMDAALGIGAVAVALGSAFMLADEAGTSPAHREALKGDGETALTRAFTGRPARGIVNRFMREHEADAPVAYPEIHYITAPIRAAARAQGDPDGINLWAGQAYTLAREEPAADIVARLTSR